MGSTVSDSPEKLAKQPPSLSYNPHGDVAYSGRKE